MRICFIIEYYYPHVGGAEILFQHLAEGLVKAGHSCDVVTCRLPGSEKEEEINGVRVHRVSVPRFGDRYWFTFLALAAGWKHARTADVIHTMVYNGALPAKVAALLRKKPVIIHVFEVIGSKWNMLGIHPLLARMYRILETIVLKIPFDAYSCISISTQDALLSRGIPRERLFLAYPGIDYALFDPNRKMQSPTEIRERLGIPNDRFLYTFYGRPGFVKGVQYLVSAVPLVKERLPHSTLLLILSRKPESGRLRVEQLVRELLLVPGKDVVIIDPVQRQELPAYIAASDCVVVPSLSEGFGFTCAEACAMHRPVVVTRAGSLPEVVSGQYVLVQPGSDAELAAGIIKISNQDCIRSEEKRFLWEDHVQKHVEAYQKLTSRLLS